MSSALTNITTTTHYSSAKRVKWETQLIQKAEARLLAEKFATTKVMGKGEAGTYRLNRLLRIAKKTTQDSESTLYTASDAKKLQTNYIDVTPMEFGDSFGFTDDVGIEAFITDDDNQNEIADQFARSMEYQVQKILATQGMRHRIDSDGTYQVSGTVTTANTAGTSLISTSLTQADDAWNGGYATITNPDGPGYDETSAITDFVASSDTATVAFTNGLTTDSKYRITVGTGLAASDVMTTDGLLDVRLLHSMLRTELFDGGTLNGFIHASQERDLWDDTIWQNSAIYDDSGRFKNYQLVRWAGMNLYVGDELYREDVDGTENQSTGVVHIAPIFGKKAYSVIRWGMGMGSFGVQWLYKDQPDSGDLRNKAKFISWKSKFAARVMRATSVVNLMTGATSPNLLVM